MSYESYYTRQVVVAARRTASQTKMGLPEDDLLRQADRRGRDLEHDLKALADRARGDRGFAVELYGALCNASKRHDDGTDWPGATWRAVAGMVADLRGRGEDYLDFCCSGGEGEVTARVAGAMAAIGWHGDGHGVRLHKTDFATGITEVLGDDGEWAVESGGTSD